MQATFYDIDPNGKKKILKPSNSKTDGSDSNIVYEDEAGQKWTIKFLHKEDAQRQKIAGYIFRTLTRGAFAPDIASVEFENSSDAEKRYGIATQCLDGLESLPPLSILKEKIPDNLVLILAISILMGDTGCDPKQGQIKIKNHEIFRTSFGEALKNFEEKTSQLEKADDIRTLLELIAFQDYAQIVDPDQLLKTLNDLTNCNLTFDLSLARTDDQDYYLFQLIDRQKVIQSKVCQFTLYTSPVKVANAPIAQAPTTKNQFNTIKLQEEKINLTFAIGVAAAVVAFSIALLTFPPAGLLLGIALIAGAALLGLTLGGLFDKFQPVKNSTITISPAETSKQHRFNTSCPNLNRNIKDDTFALNAAGSKNAKEGCFSSLPVPIGGHGP